MAKFEVVSKYADAGLTLPVRKTADSAGYDLCVAEDCILPSYWTLMENMSSTIEDFDHLPIMTLADVANHTKSTKSKVPLISTGMKCKLDHGTYLELSVRSSTPLKHWIILANSVGIIDADYYNNPDNEGEIFLQLINLSPFDIKLKKGEAIGQGIIKPYGVTEDDIACGQRMGGFGSTGQ